MTKGRVVKTVGLSAIGGIVLAGLLAVAISELDHYYDWLLVQQSVWLGFAVGGVAGAGIAYYQSTDRTLQHRFSTLITSYFNRSPKPVKPKGELPPGTTNRPGIWGIIGRSSLGGLLGLLLGALGGIWYCVELYGNLSSDAQGWVILYLPFYAFTAIFCAVLGFLTGVLLGMVWSFLRSSRS